MDSVRYPSDCSDEEWAFAAPYLTLMREDSPQRVHSLRELFNGPRHIVRAGNQWRMMPKDLPPWKAVYGQTRRWIAAGCFAAMANDLREPLRVAQGRRKEPSAAIFDGRVLRSTPESGPRAGFDGHKKTKGGKVHLAVDTLGRLLALTVTKAGEQERTQVAELCRRVQEATGQSVEHAWADQVYTGEEPRKAAEKERIRLEAVRLEEAKKGFALLPRRWVVERSFAWASRFRRLARDYERLAESLAGYHVLAFAILMLVQAVPILKST